MIKHVTVDDSELITFDAVSDPDSENFTEAISKIAKERLDMRLWVLDAIAGNRPS